MTTKNSQPISGIAVIGMACRFPGAASVEAFWENLCAGVESIRALGNDEMLEAGLDPEELDNPKHVAAAAALDGIDRFDAAFFGINAREAEVMDPQHKVFLECAWEALEDAGYDSERYEGAIGVFGGGVFSGYAAQKLMPAGVYDDKSAVLQTVLANEKDYLTTRVSYKLNLRGPSYNVQSGCSTSLVAVHLACQNLLNFESDMALAGGIALSVDRKQGYYHHEGSVSSPDGHCRAFDAKAKGTVFGDGVGIVVLKRLEDALADGDTVHAVILGSATNNDGSHKVGFTAPSVSGQSKVIVEALADAGVPADSIGYVEAHGTGTTLGDPIEVEAMTRAFAASTARKQFCAIGSVKTNVGHLDSAAGISGLIKAVLSLRHGLLPASLNFDEPNPKIEFDETPFFVNTKLTEWRSGTRPGTPRRAGVSSFGMGGTNAHVVLQEAPAQSPGDPSRRSKLLVLSGRSRSALDATARNLAAHLQTHTGDDLADVAYTLQVGRAAFSHRRAVVCRDDASAVDALGQGDSGPAGSYEYRGDARPVAFLFPGQGAQYVDMARGLYDAEAVFRAHVDRCCVLLQPHLGLDLRKVLYPSASNPAETQAAAERLVRTEYAQPALFVIEYALAQLWMEWGVQPAACIGHSLGEYVAACLAGVFSLEDALKVVAVRGRLMQQLPAGAMTAVAAAADDLQLALGGDLAIAAANAPRLTVVSGPIAAIERFEEARAGRADFRRLQTSHAFHSPMMEPIVQEFTEVMAGVALAPPALPYVSNVTGKWIDPDQATSPEYWAAHLRRAVRFGDGIRCLLDRGPWHLLEVGPGRTLSSLVKQAGAADDALVLTSLPPAADAGGDDAAMLGALGRLWQHGVPVNWAGFHGGERRRRVSLPSYPFERERYWVEPTDEQLGKKPAPDADLSKQADIARWFYVPEWRQTPPAAYYAQGRTVDAAANWLVFASPDELSANVIERLGSHVDRSRLVTVYAGEAFAVRGPRSYALNPESPADYVRLFAELDGLGQLPGVVAHLWCAPGGDSEDTESDAAGAAEAAQQLGFFSVVWLAQALVASRRDGQSRPAAIKVVTSHLHEITGEERLRPERATVLAPCRVISQEYPEIRCSSVDVAPAGQSAQSIEMLAGQIVSELVSEAPDAFVAYRGGRRWSPMIEPVALAGGEPGRAPLRQGGVYLIIGGLGSIGAAIARHLAVTTRARLVLVNRSPLPPPEQWEKWLSEHGEQDPTSARIRVVRGLEASGSEVLVCAADVADRDQMAAIVERATARFGAVHGIIHAAGLAGAGAIQAKTGQKVGSVLAAIPQINKADCDAQFRPKMRGLFVLEDVLGDRPLDFCLIVSSLSTVLGGPGYSTYAAANLFMDVFVRRHNQQFAARWLNVNWDAWSFSNDPESAVSRVTISEAEGVDVFERLLGALSFGHLVVSTVDLYARLRPVEGLPAGDKPASGTETSGGGRTLYGRPKSLESSYEPPRTPIEQTVADIWQEVLGMDRVGRDDNFFELGGHSLLAVQVAARLEDALTLQIPMRTVFDASTVADLAARLETVLAAWQEAPAFAGADGGEAEELEI